GVFVILAHLEQGSILVRPGERVSEGTEIGRCGNSGNTSVPHLHIHAQPRARVAPGSMPGIPIVFGNRKEPMIRGEVLAGK
ncbi:MAG TPA: peptidoglycan DD-metalloendopeptidase family protein, partial [Candidatus Saccharimonadales bacterium]|nr:peptidoglycan DD-metalloendopeptidase family protein [Candidatus Saccharimonadales bacterium]